jgi:hypothetical protein
VGGGAGQKPQFSIKKRRLAAGHYQKKAALTHQKMNKRDFIIRKIY